MHTKVKVVAVGASAGGLKAIRALLSRLGPEFRAPLLFVQHLSSELSVTGGGSLVDHLRTFTHLTVKEAHDKEEIRDATLYVAPPDYHLLVEKDGFLSLSKDPKVSFSRPSIDVLFESAADAFGARLIAVVLSGANSDGADGAACVSRCGGTVVIQNPDSAECRVMPGAAKTKVDTVGPALVLNPEEIGEFLTKQVGITELC